jgi:thioredoxin 2
MSSDSVVHVVCPRCDTVNRAPGERLEPRVRLAKVNTEEEPSLAARFNIRSIPTLILFRGGREVARQAGAMDGGAIERWVGQHV